MNYLSLSKDVIGIIKKYLLPSKESVWVRKSICLGNLEVYTIWVYMALSDSGVKYLNKYRKDERGYWQLEL
jgi:hypothetical protein